VRGSIFRDGEEISKDFGREKGFASLVLRILQIFLYKKRTDFCKSKIFGKKLHLKNTSRAIPLTLIN